LLLFLQACRPWLSSGSCLMTTSFEMFLGLFYKSWVH
jgi:hypothetical protein